VQQPSLDSIDPRSDDDEVLDVIQSMRAQREMEALQSRQTEQRQQLRNLLEAVQDLQSGLNNLREQANNSDVNIREQVLTNLIHLN